MADQEMVDWTIDKIGVDLLYAILHCTSTYPRRDEELNLNYIPSLKKRYPNTKIGFSNHHPGILGMIIAVALGAEVLEMHITLDRSMYGSDQAASIEPAGVWRIAKYCKSIEKMKGSDKKRILEREIPIMRKLRRI